MNAKKSLAEKIEEYDYLDLHIHLDKAGPDFLSPGVLYFASSVNRKSYDKTKALARLSPQVVPMFGIHPMTAGSEKADRKEAARLIGECGLIGEIGLDFHWVEDRSTDEAQRAVFRMFLSEAARSGAPPVIHTKGAEEEVLSCLEEFSLSNALIHWYSGPVSLIPAYVERGCFFTVGPDVLGGSEIARFIPRDRLLCETDNPTGMPWICGGEAKGDDIKRVYRKTASLLGIREGTLIKQCRENALRWITG